MSSYYAVSRYICETHAVVDPTATPQHSSTSCNVFRKQNIPSHDTSYWHHPSSSIDWRDTVYSVQPAPSTSEQQRKVTVAELVDPLLFVAHYLLHVLIV